MRAKGLRLIVPLFGVLTLGLLSTAAYADDPTVPIVGCVRNGGNVSVPAGSQVTFTGGWTMATRGNTQVFANATTGIMTVDGQAVTPVQSDVFQLPFDADPYDAWRVQWSFTTTAPALGQSMVVTFIMLLSRPVADHEGGLGKPFFLQPGLYGGGLTGQDPFTCTVTGI